MRPVIPEVEREPELLARAHHTRDFGRLDIQRHLDRPTDGGGHLVAGLLVGDHPSVGQGEDRQMRAIPPGEAVVDRVGEVVEGVRGAHREDAAGIRPQLLAPTTKKLHDHRQPITRHSSTVPHVAVGADWVPGRLAHEFGGSGTHEDTAVLT